MFAACIEEDVGGDGLEAAGLHLAPVHGFGDRRAGGIEIDTHKPLNIEPGIAPHQQRVIAYNFSSHRLDSRASSTSGRSPAALRATAPAMRVTA